MDTANTIQTPTFVKISQNTEKSLGDLMRLAVTKTPLKDYQLVLAKKLAWSNIIIIFVDISKYV